MRPLKGGLLALALAAPLTAFPQSSFFGEEPYPSPPLPAGHRGPVLALAALEGEKALSAGEDGFFEIWDIPSVEARERFQVSPCPLVSMALRPGKEQAAFIESDGGGFCRVSVWDYREKRRLFVRRYEETVTCAAWSARGNFLIVTGGDRSGALLLDPETGETLRTIPGLNGPVQFAATGRSERTMISYERTGVLSYWELEGGTEISRLSVSPGLWSPLLFGGGRFFAGFNGEGLLILNAASGAVLARREDIRGGILLQTDPEGAEFACLSTAPGEGGILYSFTVTGAGTLNLRSSVPFSGESPVSAALCPGGILWGNAGGEVRLFPRTGGAAQTLGVQGRERIGEIAAAAGTLAFLTEQGELSFIPQDYTALREGLPIRLGAESGYRRLAAGPPSQEGEAERFLLWQTVAGRDFPLWQTVTDQDYPLLAGTEGVPAFVLRISPRSALRAVELYEDRLLFLDSAGTVTVTNLENGRTVFSFSSVGALDAAFLDRDHIVLGRSAVSGNSPFLMMNTATGETVPLAFPAAAGTGVYRGRTGALYGAAIKAESRGASTVLIRFDLEESARSPLLAEYDGEDSLFSIAEAEGFPASTLGGDGAAVYRGGGAVPFERSSGLPEKILSGASSFIVLDSDGSILWHDPATGALRAALYLYEDHWILEKTGEAALRGPLTRRWRGQ